MFIGSIIALTLSLSLLAFLIVLIIIQRVRANKAAQEAEAAHAQTGGIGHVIPSNFIAPGATPPPNTPNRPRIIGKPVL